VTRRDQAKEQVMGLSDGVRAALRDRAHSEPRYWPIASYGVIGDCRTAALIAPNGSIDWLCLPHFDSPASLLRLLDHDHGGYFQVRPAGGCEALMRYLPGTNMLETRYEASAGVMRVADFMPIRKRHPHSHVLSALAALTPNSPHGERAHLERELGNDVAAAHRVDRLITCESGALTARVTLKLTPDYARLRAVPIPQPSGANAIVYRYGDATGHLTLLARPLGWQWADNSPQVQQDADGKVELAIPMRAEQRVAVALSYARNQAEADAVLALMLRQDFESDYRETEQYWTTWSSGMTYDGPHHNIVLRSALALKLCTFEPTGAIVAAPTTSLPEGIGGERNWDYRYSWLRDSSFTLEALTRLGYSGEARDYVHFLHDLHLHSGVDFRILYSIRGETDGSLRERELSHLEGYRGSQPVRIGNGAVGQRQMDIYGELADAALRYATTLGFTSGETARQIPRDLQRLMTQLADFVCDHWRDKDQGIWEERGPERAFVYSRAMCWVALDRAITLVSRSAHNGQIARWRAVAQEIRADVETNGYSEKLGGFIQAYGVETADAANLRLALVGFLPPSDPRIAGTAHMTDRLLADGDTLLYRYLVREGGGEGQGKAPTTNDGLRGGEGAFLACAFWNVSCLCLIGEVAEARRRLDTLLAYASPLGLYSEEVDPQSGAQLGNYPQAFTHLALLNALCWLNEAERSRQTSVQ
jgi:GH15 family glucan-1,4-alpha-glucosidase